MNSRFARHKHYCIIEQVSLCSHALSRSDGVLLLSSFLCSVLSKYIESLDARSGGRERSTKQTIASSAAARKNAFQTTLRANKWEKYIRWLGDMAHNIEPDEDPIREQRERARQRNAQPGSDHDAPSGSSGSRNREDGQPPMLVTTAPSGGSRTAKSSQPAKPSPTESANKTSPASTGPVASDLESYSPGKEPGRFNSASPGELYTRMNSFPFEDEEDRLDDRPAMAPKTPLWRLSEGVRSREAPTAVLEIMIKLQLMPVLALIREKPQISTAAEALRKANTALSLSKQHGMSKETQARCIYYVGVAEYVLALARDSKGSLYQETPLEHFEKARAAKGTFPEGDWADRWQIAMNKIQSENMSPNQREPPTPPSAHFKQRPMPPRAPEKSLERSLANQRKLSEMSNASLEYIKSMMKGARNLLLTGRAKDWDLGDQVNQRYMNEEDEVAIYTSSSPSIPGQGWTGSGEGGIVDSPTHFSDGFDNPETNRHLFATRINMDRVEFRGQQQQSQMAGASFSTDNDPPPTTEELELRPRPGGLRIVNAGLHDFSSESEGSPIRPKPAGGLRIVNAGSHDSSGGLVGGPDALMGYWRQQGREGSEAEVGASPRPGSSSGKPAYGGLRITNLTHQDSVSSSSAGGTPGRPVPGVLSVAELNRQARGSPPVGLGIANRTRLDSIPSPPRGPATGGLRVTNLTSPVSSSSSEGPKQPTSGGLRIANLPSPSSSGSSNHAPPVCDAGTSTQDFAQHPSPPQPHQRSQSLAFSSAIEPEEEPIQRRKSLRFLPRLSVGKRSEEALLEEGDSPVKADFGAEKGREKVEEKGKGKMGDDEDLEMLAEEGKSPTFRRGSEKGRG